MESYVLLNGLFGKVVVTWSSGASSAAAASATGSAHRPAKAVSNEVTRIRSKKPKSKKEAGGWSKATRDDDDDEDDAPLPLRLNSPVEVRVYVRKRREAPDYIATLSMTDSAPYAWRESLVGMLFQRHERLRKRARPLR